MLPYATMIPIDKKSSMPIYLQVTNGVIKQILKGRISPGLKMPGSRTLAEQLGLHRNTIIASYDELASQGWIIPIPAKGNYVNKNLPITKKPVNSSFSKNISPLKKSKFDIGISNISQELGLLRTKEYDLHFDDGCPDVRIAPIDSISRHYKSILNRNTKYHFDYSWQLQGSKALRQQLAVLLSETRGIHVTTNNIMIVRGSLMGLYLLFKNLITPGDKIVVGETNYNPVNQIIKDHKGQLITIPVDHHGLDIDALEVICKKTTIRALYVCPHHHHPTTVSLSCARRMKLLQLAETYNFAIVEDDYDYDFHYKSSPILPLMSSDDNGTVVYIGSFSKSIAPALRLGYLVAPENVIQNLCYSRRYIDRQGDLLMEHAIAAMIEEGELKRHLRKALLIYRNRRDHFCKLLSTELKNKIQFDIPEGGLTVWAKFDRSINLDHMIKKALQKGLFMVDPKTYNPDKKDLHASRLGFASMNENELTKSIAILKKILE